MFNSDSEAIINHARALHQRGLLVSADGNLSIRLSDDKILITPSALNKSRLRPEDLAVINIDGDILQGRPSSERHMHLEIYRQVPTARAITHAHPPHAIALSLARPYWKSLPVEALPEVLIAAGEIPIVPYARPGTEKMGTSLHPFLPACRLMILARHGAICWGESLDESVDGIERLEQICQILTLAESMGGTTPLPAGELQALRQLRQRIGPKIL
ncbi:MAG: class II aldolase family protein [Candidatus Melainabacteria bacterium HGW-Melainabacteria-1]|nr:MAG: class II aldolase family protein [Candidatus Melainabacteria bacterium HGW-Melainabacteria-1]